MKTFKKADLIFQIALIICFTILSISGVINIKVSYFVVGTLQVLSMLIHEINNRNTRKGSRRFFYHRITAATIIISIMAALSTYRLLIMSLLFFAAPFMAIYYTWLCYYEVVHAAKRPLELI